MGNQGHSTDDARRGQDYLASGVIGDITRSARLDQPPARLLAAGHPASGKFDGDWKQLGWSNAGRDTAARQRVRARRRSRTCRKACVGICSSARRRDVAYHPLYHPFNWRGWVDWGQGALGDMGAHLMDHPVWGLKLGLPTSIETISTPFNGLSYPNATTTYYEFPAHDGMPAVKLTWYDGGFMPQRPVEMGDVKLEGTGGVLYIGTKGKMLQDNTGARPRLLPVELHNSAGAPPERMPRVPHQAHEMNWVNAIKGTDTVSCPFSYAAHLTEIMLLGVAALRAGTQLHYDGEAMRITNHAAANDFLTREYRKGFGLA